jgi:hypothetical protein
MWARVGCLLLLTLTLSGCDQASDGRSETAASSECSGVRVVVDYGLLADNPEASCVDVPDSGDLASNVLRSAGYVTEGTDTYGDLVVCRVNGLPSPTEPFDVSGEDPYVETCADMPPAFAYWALWQKGSSDDAWDYAQEGVGTLQLMPGMSIGLVFSTGGDTPTPDGQSD